MPGKTKMKAYNIQIENIVDSDAPDFCDAYIESCEHVFPWVPAGSDSEEQRVKPGGPSVPVNRLCCARRDARP